MKTVVIAEKKLAKKVEKARKKSKPKNQSLKIRRLVLKNSNTSKISIFKNIFLDLFTKNPDKLIFPKVLVIARLKIIGEKKTKDQIFISKCFS